MNKINNNNDKSDNIIADSHHNIDIQNINKKNIVNDSNNNYI